MPDGVVQWFDPATGEAAIVRGNHVFVATRADMESAACHAGARVHFDVSHDSAAARAVNVTLREGTRVSRRQRRFGDLSGSHHPDASASAPFPHAHPELGHELGDHPLEVARSWASFVVKGDLDTAMALYAPDAVVHTADGTVAGRSRVLAFLETSGLIGSDEIPVVHGTDDMVTVIWARTAGGGAGLAMRCRIAHAQIAEQWVEPAPTGIAPATAPSPIEVSVHGRVEHADVEYARKRLESVIDHLGEPVLFARLRLTMAADPARERPAMAQASLDIDGEVLRAHVAAQEMNEAADLLQRRLLDQVAQRASHRRALRRRSGLADPGEWRHGDLPTHRPDHFERPRDERRIVRHKTFALEELTPDEAAFDMEQLDYDFHLFRDLASGEDALLERLEDQTYRLTRLHPVAVDPGPTAIPLTVAESPPATATVSETVLRIDASDEPFVFFADPATGRGAVLYRRYDGHYGLITAA